MKIAVIGFTRSGSRYAKKMEEALLTEGHDCLAWGKGRDISDWESKVQPVEGTLREWTEAQFHSQDALVFIGATGIAVRAIAPFVQSKATDPAVLCMDEQGNYLISLLSGHLGGANELAVKLAGICGAVPVITTATDINGKFSVDSFARKEHLYLDNLKLAKRISAEILENRKVGLYSDFEICSPIPLELSSQISMQGKRQLGISISLDENYEPFAETLHLIPEILVLGIGCKKGTSKEQIQAVVRTVMEQNQFSMHSIRCVASIDLKKEEEGLLAFCGELGVELWTFSAEELRQVSCEDGFTESDFVAGITGVGNVCERSALRASGCTKLIQKKAAMQGVTVAIAMQEYKVCF
jgi:cobalt-precorrin 5A hydrolase